MSRARSAPRGLLAEGGRAELLLGNEAIVRGALEAGVGFATGYPGTPSSEVTDGFARVAAARHIHFEYAINEKIAVELAYAASLAGARSIVAMKHLGLSSAGDPLSTIPYMGVGAGMVIVSAGDPGCHTSPNEQDQRHLADMLHLPTLDPSTPDEALRMTRFAFELSEACKLPVLLRPTTRVCHARAAVRLGALRAPEVRGFQRDPARLLPVPVNARRLRGEIEERLERARRAIVEDGSLFSRMGQGRRAVLSSGAAAGLCADVLRARAGELSFVRLGVVHPLPSEWLCDQLRGIDELLVVEELSPFLEDALRTLASVHSIPTRILGMRTGHVPKFGEHTREVVARAVAQAFGGASVEVAALPVADLTAPLTTRPPILCSGCPHRTAFVAVKAAFGDDTLMFNDIGCYTLGASPPFHAGDALLCMGAGIALAAGVSRVNGQRTVAFIGDSTFFHSGMPALLDVVKEDADVVTIVLDNDVTAMTGFQESPLVQIGGERGGDARVRRRVDIETVVRALGIRHVERVDPWQAGPTLAAFERARDAKGPSVVILERPCPVFLAREGVPMPPVAGMAATSARTQVDPDRCQKCGRAALGHRCRQSTTVPFERQMARARSLEEQSAKPAVRPDVAPCASRCPLFLCVQGYTTHVAAGQYALALELILDGLPLPESVCRVCHRPCEDACVRAATDEPVAINDLKRFVVEWANDHGARVTDQPTTAEHGARVAVVGGGPAGLAAAYELRTRGYRVALFDARGEAGGMLRWGIPEYRLPKTALARDIERVLASGVVLHTGRALGRDLSLRSLTQEHDAVVLAIGAWRPLTLDLPSDGSVTVVDALAYLERGDAETAARVIVVGGGNSAVDAARTARRRGATSVTIACLEERPEMPAIGSEIDAALHEGVTLSCRTRVLRGSIGKAALARVDKVNPLRTDPGAFQVVPGSEHTLDVDQLIVAIGQGPDLAALAELDLVRADGGARLLVDDGGGTSHARVFAAGDLAEVDRTVTSAVASGRRAAWGVDRALRGEVEANRRPPPPRPIEVPSRQWPRRTDRLARAQPAELAPAARVRGFDEVVARLSEADARREAARCQVCGLCGNCAVCIEVVGCPAFAIDGQGAALGAAQGASGIHIDPALCIDCRVCVATCPNGAIT